MRGRDLRWLGAGALAVAAALAVVAAGALGPAPSGAGGTQAAAQPSAAPAAEIEVLGARDVPALSDDDGAFAEALAGYLDQAGEQAETATVVPDPADPSGGSFYASAGGLWYSCESVDSASGWAFSALGAQSPVAQGRAGDHDPGGGGATADPAPAPTGEAQGPAGPGPDDGWDWIPLSDARALDGAIGPSASSQLAEAMAGYAAAKGVGFDAASARVDASSVRAEPGGVGFEADTGAALLDVVYAGGEYGFKVI